MESLHAPIIRYAATLEREKETLYKGWSTVLITALGSWEKLVSRSQ
jgi:hypothetical protein